MTDYDAMIGRRPDKTGWYWYQGTATKLVKEHYYWNYDLDKVDQPVWVTTDGYDGTAYVPVWQKADGWVLLGDYSDLDDMPGNFTPLDAQPSAAAGGDAVTDYTLRECPFCGGEAELLTSGASAMVRCTGCGASTAWQKRPRDGGPITERGLAVGRWNSRMDAHGDCSRRAREEKGRPLRRD